MAQQKSGEQFVQVTGIVVDEQYSPLHGVAVVSQKLRSAVVSNSTGIYSLTSLPGDTIMFRYVGYKRYHSIIPADYKDDKCSLDIMLELDTISIDEVTILPWRTYQEFLSDITAPEESDQLDINFAANVESIYISIERSAHLNISSQSAYRNAAKLQYDEMRLKGQIPVNNLLNPFAWAKLISSIKNGTLFRKGEEYKPPQPAEVIDKKSAKKRNNRRRNREE